MVSFCTKSRSVVGSLDSFNIYANIDSSCWICHQLIMCLLEAARWNYVFFFKILPAGILTFFVRCSNYIVMRGLLIQWYYDCFFCLFGRGRALRRCDVCACLYIHSITQFNICWKVYCQIEAKDTAQTTVCIAKLDYKTAAIVNQDSGGYQSRASPHVSVLFM
jgi:hypothetical protein